MAARDDSVASGKKSGDAFDDLPMFNAENLQSNLRIINYSRTFMSIIRWSGRWNFGIYRLDGFRLVFSNNGNHFSGTIGKGEVLCSHIL
ncbi:hypothetical protein QJS10_CPB14g00263 [Acorus calamus]|uniref:Uncharacterized protein n=1 Tax=Acorus calamus TaxID=4465 RepID=A0AAV9DDG9_ACOCL|nr:hypothetical protein QJS10_CPB14g00263 [Acorus calamus]